LITKSTQDAAREGRFAGAELPNQEDHQTRRQSSPERCAERERVCLGR
jgi:hypothetical protein